MPIELVLRLVPGNVLPVVKSAWWKKKEKEDEGEEIEKLHDEEDEI